jgi:putative ABC transport system permease protein
MRKGATAELNSVVRPEQFKVVKFKPGIQRDASGQPLAGMELVTVIVIENEQNPSGININVRGVSPSGIALREGVKVTAGRMFQPGRREVVVGKSIAERYPAARIGNKLKFGRGEWEVVGVMDGGRSAVNSELWVDLNQIAQDQNRSNALSTILVRTTDEVAKQALINDLKNDRQLNMDALSEREYYAQQTNSATPIKFLGYFVSVIMAIGSSFAAMNTMYAAVARRGAEIGTLRVLGFSKFGILTSFMIESLLLSLIGGLVGCLLVIPLNNFTTSVGSFVTFSEISFEFRVTPVVMMVGVGFALVMGVLGGLFPAASAARKEILAALRQA